MSFDVLHDEQLVVGEAPVWVADAQELWFVDVLKGHLFQVAWEDRVTTRHSYSTAPRFSFAFPGPGTSILFGLPDGVGHAPSVEVAPTLVRKVDDRPDIFVNDGNIDPAGRLVFGTWQFDRQPTASLYSLDEEVRLNTLVDGGVGLSNGLDWSPDGTKMYYIDSPQQRIDVFDYSVSTGEVSERRPFVGIPAELGLPDGMTVDADGHVWVALYGGSAIHRYSPAGALVDVLETPVRYPTSCVFAGPKLDHLVVTSGSLQFRNRDESPGEREGNVLVARVGTTGKSNPRFAGIAGNL